MNQMSPGHVNFLRWLDDQRLGDTEPLLLLGFILALLAVVLAALAVRRTLQTSQTSSSNPTPATSQDTLLRLSDLTSKTNTEISRLREDSLQLQERLTKLEREFALLTRRSYEQFQKDVSKHAEPAKTSAPAPSPTSGPSFTTRPTTPTSEKKTEKSELDLAPEGDNALVSPPIASESLVVDAERDSKPAISVEAGLQKTRSSFFSRLKNLFSTSGQSTESILNDLEEVLISSDLGVRTTSMLLARLREHLRAGGDLSEETLRHYLKHHIRSILQTSGAGEIALRGKSEGPLVVLIVGVNGVGKTTSIAKLAYRLIQQKAKVVIGAGDTFRAAAVDQLKVWGERLGADVISGEENAKPATIAYTAVHEARNREADVLLLDTAGRLHTRANLMSELGNVVKIIQREYPGAPHEVLLVIDATTGQNAVQQAKEFHAVVPLTGLIVTKLDGTPKGGIVVGIREELGVPVRYIGIGEGMADLKPFNAEEFVDALFTPAVTEEAVSIGVNSERGQVRRRRREEASVEG